MGKTTPHMAVRPIRVVYLSALVTNCCPQKLTHKKKHRNRSNHFRVSAAKKMYVVVDKVGGIKLVVDGCKLVEKVPASTNRGLFIGTVTLD